MARARLGRETDPAALFYHVLSWIRCGSHGMTWLRGGSREQKTASGSHAEVDMLGVPLSPGNSSC